MTRLIWSNDKPPSAERTADESSSGRHDHLAHALCAGERAPDFRLPDQVGHLVTLSALLAKGPVVLRFCRHRDAPPRLGEMDGLAALHLECEKRGATLAVISTPPPHPHPADRDTPTYAFLLLADKGASVARSYGLLHGATSRERSRPPAVDCHGGLKPPRGRNEAATATYIVDQRSVVALAFVDREGRSRMEPDQIIMALECLSKRKEAPVAGDRGEQP